jgi:hypothetical protein
MSNIVDIIKQLPDLLPLKGATNIEIDDALLLLRLNFSDEYREYLAHFGAIMADGIELTGIAKAKHRDVVTVTKQEWALNPNVPHTMYVIENTGIEGVIIWQDANGSIYKTTPNAQPRKIANSLADYISGKLE